METDNELVFVSVLFFITLCVLLGVIYYVIERNSTTEEVLSLLNKKVSVMANQIKDSKSDKKKSLSDIKKEINQKFENIQEDVIAIHEVAEDNTYVEESIVQNKQDILSNESGLSSNVTMIRVLQSDYGMLDSNVAELKEFEATFTSSLADLNTSFDERKIFVDDKISTLEIDKQGLNTRIQSNYGMAWSNQVALSNNRTDIDTTYALAISNQDKLLELQNDTSVTYSYLLPNMALDPIFRLVNHTNSKYITHHDGVSLDISDPYFIDGEGNYKFACEPKDYLLTFNTGNRHHQHAFLFKGMFGNTNQNKYLIIDQLDLNIPIEDGNYIDNVFQTDSVEGEDLPFARFKSLYVPCHMDLTFKDTDKNEEKRLRDYYPTQIFISYNPWLLGEFWEFVYGIRNGHVRMIQRDQMVNSNMYKYRVSSVFLRNKSVPFSVVEFQQNETVYWADLMSFVSLNYKFKTNNDREYGKYVIYIPEGAGILILDVNNVEIHALTHTTSDLTPSNTYVPIEPILCEDNTCRLQTNPILATQSSMTIQIKMKPITGQVYNPYKTPVFKVV